MASNRFLSLYFAMLKARKSKYPVTTIWICISTILAVTYTVVGLPENCGFLYIPEEMLWLSEDGECSQFQYDILFYTVLACSMFSNTLNITTAGKLVFDKVAGMSASDSQLRRRMYIRKFSQCVLQDCLHAFDMINCTFIYKMDLSSIWLQFMCFSGSFVGIHMLDGLVMFFFHADVQPKWLRKTFVRNSIISVTPAT
ncbi:hypothetical protein GCK72_024664 [Caenorhabditis remanei]|uniref:7TM GPCR serpentine receptor class x (Srx) domain-containing protein n=1 Tax=Caenorhabditis remanei TaxID=31234 RepID=A0A6A5FZX0_CAERE|nr:hypothetical protein GCK72_024664 [Caenorhabditis remanei]KAF1748197.1 hypothetical protein GCK72_024664 [Caenorhabditis remanei]